MIVGKKPTYDLMIISQKKIHDKFILICDDCVKKELKKNQNGAPGSVEPLLKYKESISKFAEPLKVATA